MTNILLVLLLIAIVNIGYVIFKCYVLLQTIDNRNLVKQSEAMSQEIQKPKSRKQPMKAVKKVLRGRSVTEAEDLVDISEMSFEEGYEAIKDLGNG